MNDSSQIYGQLTGPAVIGFTIIIILLIIMIVALKFSKNSGKSQAGGSQGLNLVELKKQGILTPEELEKVGKAMLRQMDRQSEHDRKRDGLRSGDLLLDPEVRRLETLASVAKSKEPNEKPTLPMSELPSDDEQQTELESVILPPDIQDMADSGLISPEELTNIKKRMLAQRKTNPPSN